MKLKANRLGEMLLESGLIDQFQLESALSMQRNLGGRIGSALVKLGYLPEETILEYLETQEKFSRISLEDFVMPESLAELISFEKMLALVVLPVELRKVGAEKTLRVAMTDPTNMTLMDNLQFTTGCRILPVLAAEDDILEAINRNMPEVQAPEPVDDFGGDDLSGQNIGYRSAGPGHGPVNDFGGDDLSGHNMVDFSSSSQEDPRLDRLLEVLQQKGILSAIDIKRIKFG